MEDIEAVLTDPPRIDDGNFTKNELCLVKESLKEGKQSGPDNIPPEVLKRCDLDEIILDFANNLLEKNEKPMQWSEIDMKPLPKSGDLSSTQNYRGISLTSTVAKLINKMILKRIQGKLDPLLRPNQNGFRPGRTTTAHILGLRRLIEGVRSHNRKAIILYVDFKKAFDSIDRGKMFQILKAYGVPPRLLKAIIKMYEGTKAKVISPDGETDFFQILAGVLQGDTLAPYLFVIVLDYVMRETFTGKEEDLGFKLHRRRSRRNPAVCITDLDFADDLALLTEEMEQAQEVLTRMETEAAKVGLKCNARKTELQIFNQTEPVQIKTLSGEEIKIVNNFKYLGAWTESTEKDLKIRKALAWSACHKLDKIWTSKLSRNIKIKLFIATVESVLLYGSEAWTLTVALSRTLDGCYTRLLRKVLNISWKKHPTNQMLYQNLPPVTMKVKKRRMRLAGHCIRHPEEISHNLVLWEPTEGRRSRGAPRRTFIDNLLEDTGLNNTNELRMAMRDRANWRSCIDDIGRPDGRPK